jgi:hypothetical protein
VATTEERNSRLDALKTATEQWAKKRTKELKDQVTFGKRLLKGRTGSERLASAAVAAASSFVVDEIDTFLTGG